MSEVPNAGWREVYRWCHVPMPQNDVLEETEAAD